MLSGASLILVPAGAGAAITSRGAATNTYASNSTRTLTATVPAGAQPGDVLIASVGFGRTGGGGTPVLTPASGWTQVTTAHDGSKIELDVYRHVLVVGESTYTFTTNISVGGTISVTAYGGVDPTSPVDAAASKVTKGQTKIPAPSVTTRAANELLVASYAGVAGGSTTTSWTPPTGMSEVADAAVPGRSGAVDEALQPSAGSSGAKTATASIKQSSAVGALTALRPAATPPPAGPVPLIVDTDIFSSADDVGALATAFALQLKGEAKVIAVNVNTRLSRPAVATNSWKCVAAIDNFYGFPNVPIGSHMPDNGTEVNTADFIGPCAQLAPSNTPAPDTAVNVYRRALASQPDGSVVIASTGYKQNLADLLNSPADAISPLNGRDLVARKVRMLVSMAGGYPTSTLENNLAGDPASAQYVAANWPTPIVWSGVEVGDAVHTGNTISSVHPATSPVRVAYEAFVGPNNWIYSYDLTAVYHAVRAGDASLVEVGPGTNAIDNIGGNVFTIGAGRQYYLKLTDPGALDASIEALLDTLPPASSATLNDNFDSNTIDPKIWTIDQNGSTVAAANGELEITHPGGSDWTTGNVASKQTVDLSGGWVEVQVKRPANDANGGSTFGETSVQLRVDSTHYVEFFFAGSALTAWVDTGGGAVNLTPSWPRYDNTAMQWVRFRETGGTLYYEYNSDPTASSWTQLAATPYPFGSTPPAFRIVAGSNLATDDMARFDNVATSSSASSSSSGAAQAGTGAAQLTPSGAPTLATPQVASPSHPSCRNRWNGVRPNGPAGHADLAIDAACLAADKP